MAAVWSGLGPGPLPPGTVQAGDPTYRLWVDGQEVVPDVPPLLVDGRLLVPIRFVAEALGAQVAWDGPARTARVTDEEHRIEMVVGSPTARVDGAPVPLDVPPVLLDGRVLVPLRFVAESLGLQVDYRVEADGTRAVHMTRAEAPSAADNPWGVSTGAAATDPQLLPRGLELASQAGIGYVRIAFGYSRTAPAPGKYRFEVWDQVVAAARAHGLRLVVTLGFVPAWNSTAPRGEDPIFYPPRDLEAWADYVRSLVARYPDILHWEIWNEPDLAGYWRGTPADYARLLAVSHAAVKEANPRAQVLLGGLALGGRRRDPDFLEDILSDPRYPAGRHFDVMNLHAYGDRAEMRRRMDYVRTTLERFGLAGRPVWVTESGYGSDPADQPDPAYRGPEGQAAWLRDHLPYLRELGADKVFWFKLFDSDADAGARWHGLIDERGQPKPAYDAYREVIRSGGR